MNRKPKQRRFEIGQKAYVAILTISISLMILGISSLAIYAIYKATNCSVNTSSSKVNYKDVYNVAAILSPETLGKRGIPKAIINQKKEVCLRYIARNKSMAKVEEMLYGIPAEITLAQALLESDAGQSRLARQNKNHFGIKCFSRKCNQNHCSNFTDDSHKDFFRIYPSIEESYRAHSLFLLKDRYKSLFNLAPTDIEGWAYGLQQAGYATDKTYGKKLTRLAKWIVTV